MYNLKKENLFYLRKIISGTGNHNTRIEINRTKQPKLLGNKMDVMK